MPIVIIRVNKNNEAMILNNCNVYFYKYTSSNFIEN